MQIDLPDNVVSEAERLAAAGLGDSVVEVIARAVENLGADRRAVQQGVDAYEAGDFRPLEEFGRDLRDQYGVSTPDA